MGLCISLLREVDGTSGIFFSIFCFYWIAHYWFIIRNQTLSISRNASLSFIHISNFIKDFMFFPSSTGSQDRREILSIMQCSSLHNGSMHISEKIETKGVWKQTKHSIGMWCVSGKGRGRELQKKRDVGQLFLFSTSHQLLILSFIKH